MEFLMDACQREGIWLVCDRRELSRCGLRLTADIENQNS